MSEYITFGILQLLEPANKLDPYNDEVVSIFNENQKVCGSRKIKMELAKKIFTFHEEESLGL
ncbi:MAG: hypothetical protein ACK5KR_01940 [Breznakia sp.]